MEVAPGIHRIEGDLGERYVCQYLLVGDERTLLVDTGLRDMPAQVIAPYLATLGRSPADLDDVLISHADVDHCGGNRALRAAAPGARLLCGELDRAWIESNAAMLSENYLWYEPYGCGPSPDDAAFLARELGGDAPVDVGLTGGETLRLGPTGASRSSPYRATRPGISAYGTRAAKPRSSSTPPWPTASATAPATA